MVVSRYTGGFFHVCRNCALLLCLCNLSSLQGVFKDVALTAGVTKVACDPVLHVCPGPHP